MKRMLLIPLVLLCAWFSVQGQVLYSEDFESGWPEEIVLINVDGLTPSDPDLIGLADSAWTIRFITQEGWNSNTAFSVSWYEGDVGPSDDWMILPAVDLGGNSILTWDAQAITSSGDFRDRYQVAISTGGPEIADFEANPLLFDTGELGEIDLPQSRMVNLAEAGYSDQTVYVAFRNFTAPFDPNLPQGPGNGGNELMIDNIVVEEVSNTQEIAANPLALEVFPNPVQTIANLRVNLPEAVDVRLELINAQGQIVLVQERGRLVAGSHTLTVELPTLIVGAYTMKVVAGNQISTQVLMIR
ncbi:MAG: choice-of-anchor J domain-containing protein [Bacteroidota bacterium]